MDDTHATRIPLDTLHLSCHASYASVRIFVATSPSDLTRTCTY